MASFPIIPPEDFMSPDAKGLYNRQNTSDLNSAVHHGPYKNAKYGRIQLIIGPMFSGKSTELLRLARSFEFARHTCLRVWGRFILLFYGFMGNSCNL